MRNDRMQEGSTAVALAMVTPGYDQDPASGVADYASHQDQAQFEADKRAVYKHPLFPLLALLFERCEQATQSSDNSTSESFNMDIQAFVQHQERDRKPFLVNDPEIDGLMIKAIQVLRIHLLELEKVQELCKDFCNRYITCLKGKMQSENLLRSDYGHHGGAGLDGLAPSSGSNGSSPLQVLSSTGNDVEPGANGLGVSRAGSEQGHSETGSSGLLPLQQQQQQQHRGHLADDYDRPSSARSSSSGGGNGVGIGGGGGGGGYHDSDEHGQPGSPGTVHGGTPLSQIGAHSVSDMYQLGQDITVTGSPSSLQSEDEDDSNGVPAAAGAGSLGCGKPKSKRGVLPKLATDIMRTWLFQHLVHPYPTEDEKRQIASDTNLTLLQVNNWFINARRRILQPMLDAAVSGDPLRVSANVSGGTGNSSTSKHQRSKASSLSKLHQSDWQSEDSGSESNGLSDADAAFSALGNVDRRRIGGDDEDSEDGGIETEEVKPYAH